MIPTPLLQLLLEQRDPASAALAAGGTKLEAFFQSYGAAEAAAMCVLLAATPLGGEGGAATSTSTTIPHLPHNGAPTPTHRHHSP